jgi:hypothetical protein
MTGEGVIRDSAIPGRSEAEERGSHSRAQRHGSPSRNSAASTAWNLLCSFSVLYLADCAVCCVRKIVMAKDEKTSKRAGSAASRVLKDGRTGKDSKTSAGSALSQRPDKKK